MSRLRLIAVFGFLLLLLSLRFFFVSYNQPQYDDGQYLSFKTTLLSEPQIFGRLQKFSAEPEGNGQIFITTSRFPELHYGDTVRISSTLKKRVLTNGKIILTMSFPKIEAVKNDENSPLLTGLAVTSFIRQKMIALFEKTLPPTSSSLLLGIVFGIKEEMPKEFMNNLRLSGVLHVIAASGMNVVMVGGFLSAIFSFFLKRQIALILSIIGILFYAVLAGLEPSIIRAAIMGAMAFSALIFGRQNLAIYSLFLAGYTMLFATPSLIFNVGFQLSFLSTLGLLYLRPLFERKKGIKNILGKSVIGEDLATTISAQLATLPVLLVNFGTYSLWSVAANAVLLWTVPILMVLGGVGAVLGLLFAPIGQIFLYLSLPFLLYFQKIVSSFAGLPGVIGFVKIPWQFIVGYYSLLIAILLFFRRRNL